MYNLYMYYMQRSVFNFVGGVATFRCLRDSISTPYHYEGNNDYLTMYLTV